MLTVSESRKPWEYLVYQFNFGFQKIVTSRYGKLFEKNINFVFICDMCPASIIANRTWVSRLQAKSVGLCIFMTGGLA